MKIVETVKESFIAKLLLGVMVTWIVLAIVFGFADLQISKALVDQDSLLGNFGADYGEAPGWGLIGISLSILIGSTTKKVKKQKLGAIIMIALGFILVTYYVLDEGYQDVINYLTMVIFTFAFSIMTVNKDWREYKMLAEIVIILAIINVLVFVQGIKIAWGRVRFRDLLSDYSDFSPWFVPQGITGNQSFPSGHTAMGWMLLPLLIVLKDRDKRDPTRLVMTITIIGWGVFVLLSRILVGAHYASDVLFATGMAAIITILLYYLFYLKPKS